MKTKLILLCILVELAIIGSISFACLFQNSAYYLFYNLIYGLCISVALPLIILQRKKESPKNVGFKKLGKRQYIVLFSFVLFSVLGQLLPKIIAKDQIAWNVLPIAILPLIMTTFFEEFLFRGFIQTRVEKEFGWLVAIVVSGLMFSLYHLGYPGFRTFGDIALLFVVGIGFAVSYKLGENNVIVSYFVNLPNAFVTYILKFNQFPKMTLTSTVFAGVTICVLIVGIIMFRKAAMNYDTGNL